MPRFLFPLALLVAGLLLTAVRADDTPGEEAIREAITILEARKAQAEKKDDKDKIDRAIADLGKLLPAAKKDGGEAKADLDLGKLVTPAMLKKKFAGKAAFNPKTNELTLVYDFATKDQLKDFDVGDEKPAVAKGLLALDAAVNIRHVAVFKTLTVTGTLTATKLNTGEAHLQTTSNVRVYGNGGIVVEGQGPQNDVGGMKPQVPCLFKLVVTEKRVALEAGANKGGLVRDVPKAGQLSLGGGPGGNRFAKVALTGVVDEDWAKEFFKD